MIEIDGKLVSRDLVNEQFVCDLSKCKGVCCVEGETGAPLELDELERLEEVYPKIQDYLTPEGKAVLETKGLYELDEDDGVFKTPLVNGKECAYLMYENGIALCGIDKANRDGVVDWPKPVSCHLYPVRVTKYEQYEAVNYEHWEICSPACDLGKQLKVPVYKFVKEPLIRKYGEEFYETLDAVAEHLKSENPE